ncbi:Hypothetical protein R9X50_00710100 [Acrodontium crateriforme]|uniref:Uncharacterized protein n=1 Tax=Acrodontium crateriforme TaxID=150365 RepID=A0AAQ3M946_9PEZI|nr:Hypothetical protein R9X50_00710100 [Acrodontium crateriforme]
MRVTWVLSMEQTMAPLQPKGGHFGLILPLCTSSATVGLALFQYPLFSSMLSATPSIAGAPFSRFWAAFIKPAAPFFASAALVSAVSGVICGRWLHTHATLETTDVSRFYVYGAVLAAGHLASMPAVAGPIKRMADGANGDGDDAAIEKVNREEMKTWFLWHTVRTLLVDIPALWCFAEGVALSFWVV